MGEGSPSQVCLFPALCGCCACLQSLVPLSTHWKVYRLWSQAQRDFLGSLSISSSFNVTYYIQSLSFQRWTGLFYLISSGLGRAGRQKTRPRLKRLDGLPLENTSSTSTDPETTDKPTLHLQSIRDSKFSIVMTVLDTRTQCLQSAPE